MSAPQITVDMKSYTLPATVLGIDGQGRTIVLCPIHRDEAYVEPDGRIVCPTQDAIDAVLRDAWAKLTAEG